VYMAALESEDHRKPAVAVQRHFNEPNRDTVRSWIKRARQLGYLAPYEPRKGR
jgi:hypothetical protein